MNRLIDFILEVFAAINVFSILVLYYVTAAVKEVNLKY